MADYSPHDDTHSLIELMIPADLAGMRLDQALASLFPEHSRSRLQGWLKSGLILLDGGMADAKRKVWGGERLELAEPPDEDQTACAPEPIALDIVFEDEHILVLDKPMGLVVHPGSGNWHGTLLNGLLHHAPHLAAIPRAGIVHRLDKDTTGLMVVAKTLAAQTDLVRQLQARSVKRHYTAIVHGHPPRQGTVDAPIGRHPTQRTRMAVVQGGRPSVTHFEVVTHFAHSAQLVCRLETGRTHQIRVHLASLGHPLVGDVTYGGNRYRSDPVLSAFPRQALHAFRLGLIHPGAGEPMEWQSPLPADIRALLLALEEEGES